MTVMVSELPTLAMSSDFVMSTRTPQRNVRFGRTSRRGPWLNTATDKINMILSNCRLNSSSF